MFTAVEIRSEFQMGASEPWERIVIGARINNCLILQFSDKFNTLYPLVNVYIAMENHHV